MRTFVQVLSEEERNGIHERSLDILSKTGCNWWVIEIREVEGLLKTKKMIEEYLSNSTMAESIAHGA